MKFPSCLSFGPSQLPCHLALQISQVLGQHFFFFFFLVYGFRLFMILFKISGINVWFSIYLLSHLCSLISFCHLWLLRHTLYFSKLPVKFCVPFACRSPNITYSQRENILSFSGVCFCQLGHRVQWWRLP